MIRVVAGLIVYENSVLVAKRKSTSLAARNLWEFPGGKVELGETDQQALQREILEELAILIGVCYPIRSHQFKTPEDRVIELHLYGTFIQDSKFQCLDHEEVTWIPFQHLDQVKFLESNKIFIKPVQDWLKSQGFPLDPFKN